MKNAQSRIRMRLVDERLKEIMQSATAEIKRY
jgi:hypothetical protein